MIDKFFQPLIFVLLTTISLLINDSISWILYGLYFFFAVISFIAKKNVDRQLNLCILAFMAYSAYYSDNAMEYVLLAVLIIVTILGWLTAFRKKGD